MKKQMKYLVTGVLTGSMLLGSFSAVSAAEILEDIQTVQAFKEDAVSEEDINKIVMAGVNAPSAMNGQPWHFSVITDKAVLEEISGGMGFGMPPGGFFGGGEGFSAPEGMEKPKGAEMPEGMEMPEGGFGGEGFAPSAGDEAPEGAGEDFAEAPAVPAATSSGTAKAGIADAPLVIIVSCKAGSDLDAGLATQNMSAEAQLLGYGTKIVTSPTMSLNGSRQAEFKEMLGIPEDMTAVSILLIGVTDSEAYDTVTGATTRNAVEDVVTYVK